MKKIIKIILGIVVLIVVVIALVLVLYKPTEKEAINIGMGVPLNGVYASDAVTKYLEAKKNNDAITLKSLIWKANENQGSDIVPKLEEGLGVISLSIDKVEVSEEETQVIRGRYMGSDLAQNYQWSDNFIRENLIAVYVKYTVDYDNTKVPYNEGAIAQYFYLVRANKDSSWYVWDQSYDVGY